MLNEIKAKLFELLFELNNKDENFNIEFNQDSFIKLTSITKTNDIISISILINQDKISNFLILKTSSEETFGTDKNWYKNYIDIIKTIFDNSDQFEFIIQEQFTLEIKNENEDNEEELFDYLSESNFDLCNFTTPMKQVDNGKVKEVKEIIQEQIEKGDRDNSVLNKIEGREQDFINSFKKYLGDDITIKNNDKVLYDPEEDNLPKLNIDDELENLELSDEDLEFDENELLNIDNEFDFDLDSDNNKLESELLDESLLDD